jgi:CubicO group peptidase (beta-lactamase class C family)
MIRAHTYGVLGLMAVTIMIARPTAAAAAAPTIDDAHEKQIERAVVESIDKKETPGAVVLAGTSKGTVFIKAYGNRSLQPTTRPMTTDTIFDLASLSKSIGCATSIMVLVDQGTLNVTDPVSKYLPGMDKPDKAAITIEQCLLHRAGFVPDNSIKDYENGATHDQMLERIYAGKLKYEPGKDFSYSDLSFIVLGEVVKAASGQPLAGFAKQHVFDPLGMTDTTYLPPESWRERIAPTEKRDGKWMVGEVHDPRAYALGGYAGHAGVFGTAEDVARWCRMLLNKGVAENGTRVLSEKTVAEMTTRRCLPGGAHCRGYGLDFNSSLSSAPRGERFEPGKTFGHTGYTGTMFWIDPEHGCFVVLLTNRVHPRDGTNISPLRRKVATIAAEALLGPKPAGD